MSPHRAMLALARCAAALSIGLGGEALAADLPEIDGEPPELEGWEGEPAASSNGVPPIGRLVGAMRCLGTLVLDPRIVVTAAHCVLAPDTEAVMAHVTFRPSGPADGGQALYQGAVWAIGSAHQRAPQLAQEASNDWAIVVLDVAPAGITPLGVRSHSLRELGNLARGIRLPWPQSEAIGMAVSGGGSPCSVLRVLWNLILHDCSVAHGSSGAPLLIWDGQRLVVIGIHTGGVGVRNAEDGSIVLMAGSAVRAVAFLAALRKVHERLLDHDELALRGCAAAVIAGIRRCKTG